MANPKIGLNYYWMDTDRYQDPKIKRLKRKYKAAGIGVYDYVLTEIYRQGSILLWNKTICSGVAEYYEMNADEVDNIVRYCVELKIFSEFDFDLSGILTSDEIQDHYNLRQEEMRRYRSPRLYMTDVNQWYRIIKFVFNRDNYTCSYCGQQGGKLECDHIVPLSKGGGNEVDNLTTSCRKCNRQKKDKSVDQFKVWRAAR